jgi:multiple sugar transport system substrate-binding protein
MKRIRRLAPIAVLALTAAACGSDSKPVGGGASGGPVTITVWHANVDLAARSMETLAASFHTANPDITVKVEQGSQADGMLTKLTTVLGTNTYPDIAYVFGTDTPALSRSDKVVDLTQAVADPAFGWSDFYKGEQEVATVGSKVVAVPALVDNLALVYNKKLFADAGVAPPTADWSWDDYRTAAKTLTDESNKVFGAGYPISGDEDTVWRFWPMIWQQGAKAISVDGKKATFDDPAFAKALELLRAMAIDDKSMYVDTNSEAQGQLFADSKIAMTITGPWALQTFVEGKVDFGVVPLPGFNGDHRTVSGPDNWMVFDNGDARSVAAIKFLQFLTQPDQDAVWSVGNGNMPVRNATQKTDAWKKAISGTPTFQQFVENFANAKDARPQTLVYPAYSAALGEAIAAVLQGQGTVAEALASAQTRANAALAEG